MMSPYQKLESRFRAFNGAAYIVERELLSAFDHIQSLEEAEVLVEFSRLRKETVALWSRIKELQRRRTTPSDPPETLR